MGIVKIDGLNIRFGKHEILKDISLQIEKGEFVTILGPIVINLMTGSLAVESVYSIPGIGSLFVDCIKGNDYPVIMGITVFYASFYMLVILLVDIIYSLIDPRIRLSKEQED